MVYYVIMPIILTICNHANPNPLGDVVISIYLLVPLSLMLFVVAIWAIYYAVKSNQFEDLDNAPDQIILDDRQSRRQIDDKQTNNK